MTAVLPASPYPNAPKPDGLLTKQRAWFLFGVAGFTKAQIKEITGARTDTAVWGAIVETGCIRGDDLADLSSCLDTLIQVMKHLGLPLPTNQRTGMYILDRTVLRRALRDAFADGAISWKKIDELPIEKILRPTGYRAIEQFNHLVE